MHTPESLSHKSGSSAPDTNGPPTVLPNAPATPARTGLLYLSRLMLREFTIAEGSVVFMLSFLFSALLGIVRQMILNAHFGVSQEASAYYAAFRLPDTIATLLTGGTLANAMIPVLLMVAQTEGEEAARRFINLILTTLLAIITLAVVFGLLVTPSFVRVVLVPGFDDPTQHLTTILTRIMLLELVVLVVVSVATAILTSRNQFLLPAIGIAVHNLSVIGGVLAAILFPSIGVYGPTWGVVLDGILQLCILVPGIWMQKIRYVPTWNLNDRHLHTVIRLLLPSGLSGAVDYAGGIVDTRFASLAHESGSIPALHNAYLLIGVPIRLLGIAIGQAAFPRLAAQVVAAQWTDLTRTLLRSLLVAITMSILVLIGLILFGRLAIRILFEHGQFDAAAGALTYTILIGYAAALPAAVGTQILTRTLLALSDTRTPLIINCLQLSGRIVLLPVLLPSIGVVAIPLAFAITSTLETLALGGVVFLKVRRQME